MQRFPIAKYFGVMAIAWGVVVACHAAVRSMICDRYAKQARQLAYSLVPVLMFKYSVSQFRFPSGRTFPSWFLGSLYSSNYDLPHRESMAR